MIGLVRRRDWRARLKQYLDTVKDAPLSYGEHDCGIGLAACAIEAMTGTDVAAQWRGRYDSAASALRMLRKDGFESIEDLGRKMLPAVHPSEGQIGDIALIEGDEDSGIDALGVVIGERITVLKANGMGSVDLLSAKVVFRVGEAAE
jgi:hypothetical protein